MRFDIALAILLLAGVGHASAQVLDGFTVGEPVASVKGSRPAPADVSPIGSDVAMKWRDAHGSAVSVTVAGDTKQTVFIEHDWGGAPVDNDAGIAGLRFGTTLDDLRRHFGSNGFGFRTNAVFIANNMLLGTNCYEAAGRPGVTLALVTGQPIATVDRAHPAIERGRLVAVILARTRYLERMWGSDRLFDPGYHTVDLGG